MKIEEHRTKNKSMTWIRQAYMVMVNSTALLCPVTYILYTCGAVSIVTKKQPYSGNRARSQMRTTLLYLIIGGECLNYCSTSLARHNGRDVGRGSEAFLFWVGTG